MRAIVTCEGCGYRQMVARQLERPETFHLVCHGCERTLLVTVTAIDMHAARARSWSKTAPARTLSRPVA